MRKPYRIALIATLLASPFAIAGPTVSPAAAQSPGYYEVPAVTPAEAATELQSSAKKALAKLSYRSLARSSKTVTIETSGPGTYTLVLTTKIRGKTVVIARGRREVTGTGDTAKIKLIPTAAGKRYLKTLKGKKATVSVESGFKPKGQGKTTKKKTKASLKR